MPRTEQSDGVRIYKGFPIPYVEKNEHRDWPAALRTLADMIERGEAEVIFNTYIYFNFYHVADNTEGYELRTGLINSIWGG